MQTRPANRRESSVLPFNARIREAASGWAAEIVLGDGALLTKWFETEEEARRYPLEMAVWLAGRREP